MDKASLIKSIQAQPPTKEELSLPGYRLQVIIIDGMVEVKCLKKKNNTKKMLQKRNSLLTE